MTSLPSTALGRPQDTTGLAAPAAAAVLTATGCLVAALAALPAYQVPGAPAALTAAAGGAAVIALVSVGLAHTRAPFSYGASLAALIVLLLAGSGFQAAAVLHALEHGPNQVLSETLPIGGGLAVLAPLVVVVWLCAGACCEIILRSPPDGGSSRGRSALAVPLVLFLACFAVASAAPRHDRWGAPILLALLGGAAVFIGRSNATTGDPPPGPDDRTGMWLRCRPFAVGVVGAGTVAAALTTAAAALPQLSAAPAALHRRPPVALPALVDPVAVMAELRDGRARQAPLPELTAHLDRPSTGYLALAELDSYDGAEWRFAATFEPTGGRIPQPPASSTNVEDQPVTQTFDLTGRPPEPLLPAIDRPLSVAGAPVVADAATGMLLPQSALPRSYTVVSDAPAVTLAGVPVADGLDPALATAPASALPPDTSNALVTSLRFLATLTGQRPSPSIAFLQSALTALHAKERRIDPSLGSPPAKAVEGSGSQAPAGTSLSAVINAVTVDRAATPEQFATFFAMTARYLGVPTRMVTGYRVAPSSSDAPLPPGTYRVTSRQAWAWVEIPVAGLGWVVADPTPDATTGAASPPPESVQAPATTVPPRRPNAVPRNQFTGGHALAPRADLRSSHTSGLPTWLLVLSGVLGVLAAAAAAGPGQAGARRAWRRRSRGSGDAGEMAVGAWLELLDALQRAGMPPRSGATSTELVADAADHFGLELGEAAASVATVADRAVFSPSSPVDELTAQTAWVATRSIEAMLARGLCRRDRLRYLLAVGSAPRSPTAAVDRSRPPRRPRATLG